MIANFFNSSKPFNILLVVLGLAIIYFLSTFYHGDMNVDFTYFARSTVIFILLLSTIFLVNFIIRKNGLTKDNSYSLLLFVLCFGLFPLLALNYKFIITHLLLLLAYRRIYSLRTIKDTKEKLFDSAIWIGVATIVYPNSFIYILLIYAGIYLFNKSTIRNIIIPLVGFVTPILIYGVYLLIFDNLGNFNLQLNYSFSFLNYNSLNLLIPITLITGYLLWAILPTTIRVVTVNNEFRTSWFLLLIHLLISVLLIVSSNTKNGSEFLFIIFPTSIILANYIQIIKEKWFKEAFLYMFFVITVIVFVL